MATLIYCPHLRVRGAAFVAGLGAHYERNALGACPYRGRRGQIMSQWTDELYLLTVPGSAPGALAVPYGTMAIENF